MTKLKVLDLFSGIGGFSAGLERTDGFCTVGFCEIDEFCRGLLSKHWPEVSIHDDVTTYPFREGEADIVCGGFPCQDVSLAGKRAGVSGSRSGLYREMVRAIRVVRPLYTVMENVAALLGNGMGTVLGDVAEIGGDAEWDCISASDVGAPHGRDRVWIAIANPDKLKRSNERGSGHGWWLWSQKEIAEARDANGSWQLQPPRLLGNIRRRIADAARSRAWWSRDWQSQFEAFRRMDDGVPTRLDRSTVSSAVARLGNAVVPQIPELIGHAILEAERAAA